MEKDGNEDLVLVFVVRMASMDVFTGEVTVIEADTAW